MAKTTSDDLLGLARGAVALGVSTARRVGRDVKEALRIDLGTILFNTYQDHKNLGYSEARARELTLTLAKNKLELQIAESKKDAQND